MAFYAELSRRKVIRVAIAYAVAAWLALQIIDVVGAPLRLPDWFAAALGEEDAALDHLETAIGTNFPAFAAEVLTFRSQHPLFDEVRDHPRFQAVLASLDVSSESPPK